MKAFKRTTAILLVAIIAIACCGCGGGDGNKDDDGSKKETVTFTVMTYEHPYQPFDPEAIKFEAITEATGVKLDFNITPDADYNGKVATTVASGKICDITYLKQSQLIASPHNLWMDLTDILESKLPNYYRWVKDDPMFGWTKVEGKHLGTILVDSGFYPAEEATIGGYDGIFPVIRYDILDENGLKIPTTVDEWYNVLKKLKLKYPDSTPWSGRSGFNIIHLTAQMMCGVQPGVGYNYNTGKFTVGVLEESFYDVVALMKRCYDEGILDKNFASTTSNSWTEGVTNNKIFFWIDNVGFAYSQTLELRKTDNDALMQVIPLLKGLNGTKTGIVYPKNQYSYSYCLSAKTKNSDRLLEFMDWCYSDEGMYINNYGKQGETFEINDDGSVKLEESIVEKYKGMSSPDYAWMSAYGLGQLCFSPLVNRAFNISNVLIKQSGENYFDNNSKILKLDDTAGNIHTQVSVKPDVSEEITELAAIIDKQINEQLPKFINGSRPLTEWNSFITTIRTYGADSVLEAYNSAAGNVKVN